jgi:hypothetical protein
MHTEQQPYGGGNTPPTYPGLVTGNGHSILWFTDPSLYPFLFEVTPYVCGAFRNGLPRVDSWGPFGELLGIELPGHRDEHGNDCVRAWMWAKMAASTTPGPTDAPRVLPESISPGLPSRPYKTLATT